VAVLAGLLLQVLPGRALPPSSRFAFADTTLLRDTLGLRFDRLFATADSLRMLPDSLRAQMIRFGLPIGRLLAMADSMRVPVDSVGAVITRERFNPLANIAGGARTTFKYTSGWNVGKTNTTWTNGADYSLVRGPMFLRNGTNINMERNTNGGRLSLRQNRESTSEASWKLSPGMSVGGRAALSGFDAQDPGSVSNEGETKSEFQLSTRTRQTFNRELSSELNMFGGYLDLKNFSLIKRGLSGDANGRVRFARGDWLSHDFTGGVNGNLSRTRKPTSITALRTQDYSVTARGALQIYQQAPVSLNLNYSARKTLVETPTDADTVNRFKTSAATLDATVRFRASNDRYLNVSVNAGTNNSLQGKREDQGLRAQARWVRDAWAFDADYSDLVGDSHLPRRNRSGGYNERQDSRTAGGQLTRPFGRKLTAKLTGNISLSQFRSQATADSASPPTPRDSYRQSYKIEGLYNASERFTSGIGLEVGQSRAINLPAQSTLNNNDTRTYRADWRWSYRLLRGLTAAQTNSVQADYQFYPFKSDRDGLSLDFNSVTNLNAVLTPRLSLDVSHNARQQPQGDYRVLADGTGALLPSEENLNYTLRSRVTWSPSPTMSFTLTPEYQASDRTGTSNGIEAPTRRSRRLNFTGGANLNLKLGQRGLLTGGINRSFTADRTTTFRNGLPQTSPLSEQDFWNGSLLLSWEL
jgi:hypothetical protein